MSQGYIKITAGARVVHDYIWPIFVSRESVFRLLIMVYRKLMQATAPGIHSFIMLPHRTAPKPPNLHINKVVLFIGWLATFTLNVPINKWWRNAQPQRCYQTKFVGFECERGDTSSLPLYGSDSGGISI